MAIISSTQQGDKAVVDLLQEIANESLNNQINTAGQILATQELLEAIQEITRR